ncbi:MAG: disulfide bond formation protein B [Burkholderiaceae bacterium]|nr:disulfide bond formation protein B [Burkholderiaceae bacterium]
MNSFAAIGPRMRYVVVALISVGLVGVALVLQHTVGLVPCPLCIFQRIAYLAVALFATVAAWREPRVSGQFFGFLALACAIAGAGIAGRHVWLEMNPQGLSCGPGLQTMLENFPLTEVFPKVFRGGGDCSETSWTLLGLTIADWSLIWFAILTVVLAATLLARRFRPLIAR